MKPENKVSYTNDTKVNVNSVHLVPFAAVWQSPKIIRAMSDVSFGIFWCFIFSVTALFLLGQTPWFNKAVRELEEDYETCKAEYTLRTNKSAQFDQQVLDRCYSAAKLRQLQKQKR